MAKTCLEPENTFLVSTMLANPALQCENITKTSLVAITTAALKNIYRKIEFINFVTNNIHNLQEMHIK